MSTIELIVTKDYEALSRIGADLVGAVITARPDAAVVVATGDTPMGVYRQLAERRRRGELDLSRLRVFQLDEYVGIPTDDARSLYGWMVRSFVEPLGIPRENVARLPGDAEEPAAACLAYDKVVEEAGGFDLAVLGLGPNGHLGFNEPPADPHAPTRMVELTEASIESNARYWGEREVVPRQAMTCGMAQLLAARRTLLLVSGAHKRDILRCTLAGPITPGVPASYLQRVRGVTVVADRDAWPSGSTEE